MLPDGWKLSCLGDACSGALQTGPFGSQLHAHEYTEHGVPVLMPKDLTNYRANVETASKISVEKSQELKRHQLKFGDILFSRRGDVARLALIDNNSKESLCGTGCLRARPSAKIFPGFLFFFLQLPTIKSWLEHNAVGQTMPNMNTEILYELPLILPPLPEQKKIAAIFSTWDRAIEGTEKLLANSQQQKKALMQQLLTGKKRLPGFTEEWKTKTFLDIFNLKIGGTPSRSNPAYWDTDKITENRWVAISDLRTAKIRKTAEHISDLGAKKSNCSLIPKGTIILSFKLTIGKKAILLEDCYTNEAICALIIKDKNEINSSYVYQALDNVNYEEEIDQAVKGKTLNKEKLARLRILAPPLPEQKAIAAVLTTADAEITALESDLSRLRQEKKALMQQLLTGKRRVRVD